MRNLHTSRASSSKEPAAPSARMPYDRANPASRQQPPAASLAKRTPVTPKLASAKPSTSSASAAAPASQRQTVTLATPVPRRQPRPDSAAAQGNPANPPYLAAKRDSYGAAHLQNNATPRAGSRQSRINSANSSPNPADSSADDWEARSGLGISATALDHDALRRNGAPAARDSKFFYASDAPKVGPTSAPSKPAVAQPKGPTFFYANGNNLPPKPSPTVASPAPFSPPLAASNPDPLASKFMYANGTPDLKPSLMTSGSGSVVSTTSRTASSRTKSGPQSPAFGAQRDPSPAKAPSSHPQPAHTAASTPTIAERRGMLASIPSAPQLGQHNTTTLRRISNEAPSRKASAHSRTGSLVAEPPTVNRILATSPPLGSPMPSPLSFSTPGLSMASVLQAAEEFGEPEPEPEPEPEQEDNGSIVSGLASPKSASGSDPLNELVANARRERKVQDLQITNASLEAINRTLERQLRKQTNELRRYKRLTRTGRLSSANTAPSSRVVSNSTLSETPKGPLNALNLSDLSEEGSDENEDDDDLDESELSESDSTGSAQMSPNTMAKRDARHRKRDEQRLQIDLSKHQQLLVDSQRMNQSLKKCLGWTEELIREGKRALAYQVRVSELDGGGREARDNDEQPYIYDGAQLWDHQHQDHNDDADAGEYMDDSEDDGEEDETMRLRIERLRPGDETDGNKSAQDRDSGIVLPGDAV